MRLQQYITEAKRIGIKGVVIVGYESGDILGIGKDWKDTKLLIDEEYAKGTTDDIVYDLTLFNGAHIVKRKGYDAEKGVFY